MRQVADRNVKMIWWFVAVVEGEKVTGTQTLVESYESQFFDVQEAVEKATFQSDRDVIETAVGIVKDTFGDGTLI
ncbi:hypothetical protein EW146_g10496 [Bondarzewia mesenterica]|nr:hypothetical protein EW146_g10496 [Bondarzewia mesenterica]